MKIRSLCTLAQNMLSEYGVQPVLIDIGATGRPPDIWQFIAPFSTYIAFDPDPRAKITGLDKFKKKAIITKAVSASLDKSEIKLFMTKKSACSSTLQPDVKSLAVYLEGEDFHTETTVTVQACNLNDILSDEILGNPKWIKTDSQGTDLRLFNSLKPQYRQTVMALDVEPGFINAYHGEDLFVDTHKDLLAQGFWMSDIKIRGFSRINTVSQSFLRANSSLDQKHLALYLRKSPCWCEARYLRSVDFVSSCASSKNNYMCLWAFALLEQQIGFALDVLMDYEKQFGRDAFFLEACQRTICLISTIRKQHSGFVAKTLRLLPARWRARCGDLLDAGLTSFRDRIVAQCREAAENPHYFRNNKNPSTTDRGLPH